MGNAVPSTEMVIKLALIFSVSTDYLLGVDGDEKISVRGLTPKEVDSVQGIVNCLREK
jgi:hypothetical protein